MNGSDEYTKLKPPPSGHGGRHAGARHQQFTPVDVAEITYSVVEIAETDQIFTVAVDCLASTTPRKCILTAGGKMTVDGIC